MSSVVNPLQRGLYALVLDEWIPYPPDSGKRVRTWNLLRRLAQRHNISLLCYGDAESEAAQRVRSAGIAVYTVPPLSRLEGSRLYLSLFGNLFSRYPYSVSKHYTQRFVDRMRRLLNGQQFDLVLCEGTHYARFLQAADGPRNLIMTHNIESQIWFRRARQSRTIFESTYFNLQGRRWRRFERRAIRQADCVAAVTDLDAQQAIAWGARSTVVVENGVDLDEFSPASPSLEDHRELIFLGSLDWYPNKDAVEYMLQKILPLLMKRLPEARLRIVGRRAPPDLAKRVAQSSGVELVGEVADVRPHLAQAAVVLVPLRIGGGSRIKILEALAMGKAVVSTTIGAEGLAVTNGVHLLLADSPQAFADSTFRLLESHEERARLGSEGRKLVQEHYSWDRAAEALDSCWQELCKANSTSGASQLEWPKGHGEVGQ